jgi:hypothetical protein
MLRATTAPPCVKELDSAMTLACHKQRIVLGCGMADPRQAAWQKAYRARHKRRLAKEAKAKADARLALIGGILGDCCSHCGWKPRNRKERQALDCHHVDPSTKVFQLGRQDAQRSEHAWRVEIAKCIRLCARCHRIAEAK